jgi:nucleoside-diphosphate-sugar epimerase
MVGSYLLPLLTKAGCRVTALSRQPVDRLDDGVEWRLTSFPQRSGEVTPLWICIAPIWVLPDYFGLLDSQGAERVVVLSSTSRFTKEDSTDLEEQALALRIADAEKQVREWAENHGVEWVILRPTLIYDFEQDKNVAEIACFIRRFGFFPLLGKANGLRQPIHAEDVADSCLAALQAPSAANQAYNISGGETLTYREMVNRIFIALGRCPRFLTLPLWVFRLALTVLCRMPRYRQWSPAMAERMGRDLVFDHSDAARDLNFKPRPFVLGAKDRLR